MRSGHFFSKELAILVVVTFLGGICRADAPGTLEQAATLEASGNYQEAEVIYKQIAVTDAGTDKGLEAGKRLVRLYAVTGRNVEADGTLKELIEAYFHHEAVAKAVHEIAREYYDRREYVKANEVRELIVENWANDDMALWAQMDIVTTAIALGREDEAQAGVMKLVDKCSGNEHVGMALHAIGQHYCSYRKYQKALEVYGHVLENRPGDEFAIKCQGGLVQANIELARYEAASAEAAKLLDVFGDKTGLAEVLWQIAKKYEQKKKFSEARGIYGQIIERCADGPELNDPTLNLLKADAVSTVQSGVEAEGAGALAEEIVMGFSEHPRLADALLDIAEQYEKLHRYAEAKNVYDLILAQSVDSAAGVRAALGSAKNGILELVKSGKLDLVRPSIENLILLYGQDSNTPQVVYSIARDCEQLGKYEVAGEAYQSVLDTWPRTKYAMESRVDLATLSAEYGDDEALREGIDCLISDFNDHLDLADAVFRVGERCYNRAFGYESEGLDSEAVECLRKAIGIWEPVRKDLQPSMITAYANYFSGICYNRLGDHEQAIECFKEVVDNWPDCRYRDAADSMMNRCLQDMERKKEAGANGN